MPAFQDHSSTKSLGHVNLMVDTLIANVDETDLRAMVRGLLSASTPAIASTFTDVARERLRRAAATALPPPRTLFAQVPETAGQDTGVETWAATPALRPVLRRTRAAYGAGIALDALGVLAAVVADATPSRWAPDSALEALLAEIDADISQAVESAKQECDAGRVDDPEAPQATRAALLAALQAAEAAAAGWGGDFPFERGLASVQEWKPAMNTGR
ncbi:uncharacterized protein BXZ73DRAFT_75572 [Epithele typhae]|uniref:uncharacterized protein n=1 Tax=Epithele typhae TaxID=378194 RepID=UPI00200729A7|nr:uncharacterized protein BXZ73DRAFT_75572 [Epithele typhae]KAH9940484.1 hypothetical protein BXZ73DRAFT_75572 [Epithele typhae]